MTCPSCLFKSTQNVAAGSAAVPWLKKSQEPRGERSWPWFQLSLKNLGLGRLDIGLSI
jgi:hypothetical protein